MVTIHAFRAGDHIDSLGRARSYSSAEIDRIARKYNAQVGTHTAPLVIGHPKDDSPAYGWIRKLIAQGESLYAEVDQIDPKFLADWKAGRYKKKSISLYPDGTLKHIGMLGGMPPAVKGLSDDFCESAEFFTFSESLGDVDELSEFVERVVSSARGNRAASFAEYAGSSPEDRELAQLAARIAGSASR